MIESKKFEQQVSYRIKKYPKSFTGSQLVKWLIAQKIVSTRSEGVFVGQQLVDLCLIYHVESDEHFQDAPVPFRIIRPHVISLFHFHLNQNKQTKQTRTRTRTRTKTKKKKQQKTKNKKPKTKQIIKTINNIKVISSSISNERSCFWSSQHGF